MIAAESVVFTIKRFHARTFFHNQIAFEANHPRVIIWVRGRASLALH